MLIAADATDKKMDGEIGRSELEAAISIWKSYLESKPDIDVIFEKFDKNESGKLEPDQLKSLLTELNDDIEPTEEEVKFILDSADGAVHGVAKTGGINRTELTQAISLWYCPRRPLIFLTATCFLVRRMPVCLLCVMCYPRWCWRRRRYLFRIVMETIGDGNIPEISLCLQVCAQRQNAREMLYDHVNLTVTRKEWPPNVWHDASFCSWLSGALGS